MHTNPSASPSLPLDIATLTAVAREVAARARDWRSDRRLTPISAAARAAHDPRLVRVDELESLGRWLDEKLADADAQEVA
jgi:hypothetical protein